MNCPNNYDAFVSHDAEQGRELRKLPVCCCCKEHIQQEKAVCIEGDWYCEDKDCEAEAWKRIRKEYLEDVE